MSSTTGRSLCRHGGFGQRMPLPHSVASGRSWWATSCPRRVERHVGVRRRARPHLAGAGARLAFPCHNRPLQGLEHLKHWGGFDRNWGDLGRAWSKSAQVGPNLGNIGQNLPNPAQPRWLTTPSQVREGRRLSTPGACGRVHGRQCELHVVSSLAALFAGEESPKMLRGSIAALCSSVTRSSLSLPRPWRPAVSSRLRRAAASALWRPPR